MLGRLSMVRGLSLGVALALLAASRAEAEDVRVRDDEGLRRAIAGATAGQRILVEPGEYRGGLSARDLRGEADRPIVIEAADPTNPPVIRGGGNGIQLSDVAYVTLRNLTFVGGEGNGLNIDDAGTIETPSHHVRLEGLVVRDVGPKGNRDGIKLSGLDDFAIERCTIERWGDGGSGIDMVGCERGTIEGCTFRHGDTTGDNGVQAKGGTREVVVRRCRFEHSGHRAVNIGGSTGLSFFRPRPEGYEAKDITVEDCTFVGSMAPVAFVGVDGAVVRRNTIFRPKRFLIRILQETQAPGFVPSRNGRFEENLVVFRSDELVLPVNVGPATAPETFTVARNAWYCLDNPARSRPRLAPLEESEGVHGQDPKFVDPEAGDFRLAPDSPLAAFGARP